MFLGKRRSWGERRKGRRRLKEKKDEEKAFYRFLLRVFVLRT